MRVLHGTDGVDSVALIDGRIDRLESLGRGFPGARRFATLEAALPYLDAVVIATPPSTHEALALQVIAAGKHLLVEKPLTTSTAGARRVIDAAAAAGVALVVGHTFEYNPAVWKLRELVQSGQLGDLYYLDSARLNLGLYQSDVNVIWDLAPHDISITNHVLGRKPVAVQAWASRHAHRRFEGVAYLRLAYESQELSANIHVSWLDPCKVRRVTAVGSKKMAVYNDLAVDDRIRVHDKGVTPPADTEDLSQPPMSYRYGDILSPFIGSDEPLSVQDKHFVECALGRAEPQTNGANGLAVVEVLEAAQLSLAEGRQIFLDELAPATPQSSNGSPHSVRTSADDLPGGVVIREDVEPPVVVTLPRDEPDERIAPVGALR